MKTVIEINGRKYDARTGELLSNASVVSQPTQATSSTPKPARATPVSIDGVNRRRQTPAAVPVQKPQPVAQPTSTKKPSAGRSLDIKPNHPKPQRAKTLLRAAVKKPQKVAPQIHGTSTMAESKVERSATGRGLLLRRTPDSRLSRAAQTAKSMTIQKFSAATSPKSPKLSKDLAVAKAPIDKKSAPAHAPAITKPVLGNTQKQEVFQHSIASASSHKASKVKKERLHKRIAKKLQVSPRVISISAAVLAVVFLASFLAYQNVPSVAMRVAANRAGFSGHLPSNTPAGFAFKGPIEYSKDNIVLKFQSNSDTRKFAIVQKPTDWTSESLLANYVLATKSRYQTYHDKGLTVFIYNDGNATWVDKGVWYSLNGEGSLSADQILAIAGSM